MGKRKGMGPHDNGKEKAEQKRRTESWTVIEKGGLFSSEIQETCHQWQWQGKEL